MAKRVKRASLLNRFFEKIKVAVLLVLLVCVAVVIDYVFALLGLPIVTADLLFLPLSFLIMYFSFVVIVHKGKYLNPEIHSYRLRKRLLIVATLLGFSILGVAVALLGAADYRALYSGAKGSVHGYTLACLGVAIAGLSFVYAYLIVVRRGS